MNASNNFLFRLKKIKKKSKSEPTTTIFGSSFSRTVYSNKKKSLKSSLSMPDIHKNMPKKASNPLHHSINLRQDNTRILNEIYKPDRSFEFTIKSMKKNNSMIGENCFNLPQYHKKILNIFSKRVSQKNFEIMKKNFSFIIAKDQRANFSEHNLIISNKDKFKDYFPEKLSKKLFIFSK